jgi:hypothetical protein
VSFGAIQVNGIGMLIEMEDKQHSEDLDKEELVFTRNRV